MVLQHGATNSIDPNYEIPSVTKAAIGIIKTFDINLSEFFTISDVVLTADYIKAEAENSAQVRNLANTYTGEYDFAGLPIFSSTFREDYELGNASEDGKSDSFSISLSKQFENVFLTLRLRINRYGRRSTHDIFSRI